MKNGIGKINRTIDVIGIIANIDEKIFVVCIEAIIKFVDDCMYGKQKVVKIKPPEAKQ